MLYTINLCKVLVVFFSEKHITYIVKHNFLKVLLLHVFFFAHKFLKVNNEEKHFVKNTRLSSFNPVN